MEAGPPLGLGGLPLETAELRLPEGSRLVLCTGGLVEGPRPGHRRRPGAAARGTGPARPHTGGGLPGGA
ncbi:SpoIIE family protein phosphatase [Streptomyces nodosus]|uniref:SpoIIE family protein phosphatase n=1 Tax=Streptomyces nodosus TaxID=40318 RepID=UPI00381DCD9E